MNPPKKFFLVGGYCYSNPGDIAILKATASRLDTLYPGSHFVIWSDRKNFSVDLPGISNEICIRRCPFFFAGNRIRPRVLLLLYRLFYPFSQTVTQKIWRKKDAPVIQKMKACDFILFVGGGYINSNFAFELFQMHYFYHLARQSGKPIYLLGQTLGPFKSQWHRKVAESIFCGAERIVLREKFSREELWKFGEKVTEDADDALDFQSAPAPAEEKKN